MLGTNQRQTLFELLDVLSHLCHDEQDPSLLDQLESSVNVVCAKLERDFPISVQVKLIQQIEQCTYKLNIGLYINVFQKHCHEEIYSFCLFIKYDR